MDIHLKILVLLLVLLKNAHFYSQPLNVHVLHIDLPDKTYKQRLAQTQMRYWFYARSKMSENSDDVGGGGGGGDKGGSSLEQRECRKESRRREKTECCSDIEMAVGNWMHSIFFAFMPAQTHFYDHVM